MKTIFYKLIKDEENVDYWFGDVPAKEWFTLENFLYDPNEAIEKRTLIPKDGRNFISSISINRSQDTFTDDGIIRRLGLYCYDF